MSNFALVTASTSKEGGGHIYKESIFGDHGDLSTAALLYCSSRDKMNLPAASGWSIKKLIINSLVKWQGRWCLLM